jgi:hypothetical protein
MTTAARCRLARVASMRTDFVLDALEQAICARRDAASVIGRFKTEVIRQKGAVAFARGR